MTATILWFRKDLRLADNPALAHALTLGHPIIPVFIRDETVDTFGAAPAWRLEQSLESLCKQLTQLGARLILRSGKAQTVLDDLIKDSGATTVLWNRLYDAQSTPRDTAVKAHLKSKNLTVHSFAGHLLVEPWEVRTKEDRPYRVYTPFWRNMRDLVQPQLHAAPSQWPTPTHWPETETLADWHLSKPMNRGATILAKHAQIGEQAALNRLADFSETTVATYHNERNSLDTQGTSGLSPHLALGEISIHRCWATGQNALQSGQQGVETFLKELAWRDFAHHLMFHQPAMETQNWNPKWNAFPWNTDDTAPEVIAWKRGRTGYPVIDAAMRELYTTGIMHNRARMIVASFLTKHLLTHWRIGQKWFEHCLIDWDIASNAMGWQWVAGSGPDAAPFFRIFNPESQAAKFDPHQRYQSNWIAEGLSNPSQQALDYFAAIPQSWHMSPSDIYPHPIISLRAGRERALSEYKALSGK